MKIFFYSAYEGSEIGYKLGFIDTDNKHDKEKIELEQINQESFNEFNFELIRTFFYYDIIEYAFGKIPNGDKECNKYIFLIKDVNGTIKEEEKKAFYLGICFETAKEDEYLKIREFIDKYSSHNSERDKINKIDLYKKLSDFIRIDLSDKNFGINIDKDKLSKLIKEIKEIKDTSIQDKEIKEIKEEIILIKSTEEKIEARLTKELNLDKWNKNLEIVPEPKENKYYRLQKKNKDQVVLASSDNIYDTHSPIINDEIKEDISEKNTYSTLSIARKEVENFGKKVENFVESGKDFCHKSIDSCNKEYKQHKGVLDKTYGPNLINYVAAGGLAIFGLGVGIGFGRFLACKSKDSDKQQKHKKNPSEKIDSKEDEQYSDL